MEESSNPGYNDLRYGQSRELLYTYDENGHYHRNIGFHSESDRVILQQAWDHFSDRIEGARQRVIAGKASPIVYYMEKFLADPLNLSMMAGISIWRVKWHLRPNVFKRLSEKTLKKYADAFNITIDQSKKVE